MLVSIITPCFNPDNNLIQTIRSVQAQTYCNYEHIIIDDHSTKGFSSELLLIVKSDPKIRFIRRAWNAGAAVTRNRGIEEAKGRFIVFLDSDDLWYPEKLEKQIAFMLENDVALSYTAYDVIDQNNAILGQRIPPTVLSYHDILKSNRIGCLTAIYDSEKLGKVYMPNIAKRQDMGLWLKILKSGFVAKGIVDEPLAQYRTGGTSISSNKFSVLKYQWQIYRDIEKLSFLRSSYYFASHVYNGLTRKV
ncbi:glycosyltransferase family 2 protein [Vibrio sp. RC27]